MTIKIKSVAVDPKRVKAGPDDGLAEGEFIVYPSTFTRKPDSYGDVVAPGAFDDDIAAWKASGNVLPGLYGHRMDDPDYFVAYALDEGTDHHGWWVHGRFDLENPKAQQVYRLVKGRRLTQLSFAYDVLEEAEVQLEDGTWANELRRVKRYEFSFVPVGANQETSVVAIKGALDGLRFKAGRVLSAKNEQALREARDAIDQVLSSAQATDEVEDEASKEAPASDSAQGQASGPAEQPSVDAAAEEPNGAKAAVSTESSEGIPPVDTWAALINIRSHLGDKE